MKAGVDWRGRGERSQQPEFVHQPQLRAAFLQQLRLLAALLEKIKMCI
jgi:hypothetical protein